MRRISNKLAFLLTLTISLLMFCPNGDLLAQGRQKQVKNRKGMGVQSATIGKEKRKAVPEFWVSGKVTSPDGKSVGNALITANEGATVLQTDKNGYFKVKSRQGSSLLIEAAGFEPLVYETSHEENDFAFVLVSLPLYTGQEDRVDLTMGVQEKQRYLVGAVSGVSGEALTRIPEPVLSNSLQGQIMGLYAKMTANGLGNNTANLFIRGQSREGDNGIVCLIDGVERDINTLMPEEIASVRVMKDATSKILYGSRAANGVLSVTTKQGKMHTRKINVSTEMGIGLPVAYPEYLNSYEYATLYNEARANDGLPPMYSAADLEGYRNSKGVNDLRYPDVDYLDYFLKKNSGYRKIALEFSGGNENTQYALVAGYNGNTGLQKVGDTPERDWFNVRANLDMKITDYFKVFIGMAGVFDIMKRSSLDHAGTFNRISNTRPNEFPLVIDEAYVPVDSLGRPALGASYTRDNNLYGALMYGGRYRENSVNGELSLGLNFDLSSLVKGLSLKAQFGFDNYFTGQESISTAVATYAQRWSYNPALGRDTVMFQQLSKSVITDQNKLSDQWNLRTISYLMGIDYERLFNQDHRISANLFYHYLMSEVTGSVPNLQTANTALRLNYSFQDKYVAEIDLALMGSDKFTGNNRYFMSYAGGLGWIVSEEDFLKDNNAINYMKIKASGGLMGYDASTPWYLYLNRWSDASNNYNFRGSTGFSPVNLVNWASPNLKWEKALDINIGAEGLLLNRKLWVEANYFNETRSDIISNANSLFSAVYGSLFGWMNIGKVRNQGIELEFKYMDKVGDIFYSLGLNGTYSKNKLLATNEVEFPLEYRRSVGKPADVLFGYVANGLFGKDVPLAGAPHQTLGYYGTGDIAYEDLNHDGLIDENDQKVIGNNFPRVNLGLNIDLAWKGFVVNLIGVSSLGVNSWLNNSYYQNFGENKWSVLASDRYHPVNNPEGSYPRLTTTDGNNNFVNSTFWLANTSFFRLKNAEIGYVFGYNKPLSSGVKTVKVFVRGSNIFTISKMKDLDPEVLNAGVSNYPLFSIYTGGLSVVF